MQKVILIVLLLCLCLLAKAQEGEKFLNGRIAGVVIDSVTKKPIDYATIALFTGSNDKAINGSVTNNKGQFLLTGVDTGVYRITIEFIGYLIHTISNVAISKKNASIDLRNIFLVKTRSTLQNVTVTAQKPLIENKIDKIVFNAEKDLTSQTGVATDILKKVPQVSVDVDGNVELSGSSSIRFLINGKPSSAFGSSITDVLQSIPASQVKSIEVITNPGAKYDAQGLGGIINIILKQSTAQGVNGNISLTAGTRMENGSFNFNARKGNFGLNAFVSGNVRLKAATPSSSTRLSIDTIAKTNIALQQDGSYDFKRHGMETGIGFDWTLKKKNNFSGSLNYDNFGNSGDGIITQSQITTLINEGNIINTVTSANHANNSYNSHNIDASLNYKRTFKKEDQELEIGVNSSFENNHAASNNYQLLLPQDSLFYGINNNNPGKEDETEVQVDYTQPLKEDVILGFGGKLNFYNISSTANVATLQPSEIYMHDTSLSNYLNYHQKVYAAYAEISFPVSTLFDAKIGGRYERTNINSFYSNAQQQAHTPGYNTFVPSVFFLKRFGNNQTIKLNYSRRIERPDYGDLNPFINAGDPKNITAGNPYLFPEIGSRYELSYSRNFNNTGSSTATAFYRSNNHDIQPFIVFYPFLEVGDSAYTNVTVTTRSNVGRENNAGINLFADVRIITKLSVRGNLFFFHRHTINVLNPGYNSNSLNYRFNMNVTYKFNDDFSAEFFGNFNSARHEAQGRYPSFTSYSIAMRKQMWNKKASIALTAANPFKEYVIQRTSVFGPNFQVNSVRKIPFRSIGINFTWKFGKLEFKKDKDDTNTDASPEE